MAVGASQAIGQRAAGVAAGRCRRAWRQQRRVVLGEVVDLLFAQLLRKADHHGRSALALTEGTPLSDKGGLWLPFEERYRRVDRLVGRVAGNATRGGEPFASGRVAARRAVAEQQAS